MLETEKKSVCEWIYIKAESWKQRVHMSCWQRTDLLFCLLFSLSKSRAEVCAFTRSYTVCLLTVWRTTLDGDSLSSQHHVWYVCVGVCFSKTSDVLCRLSLSYWHTWRAYLRMYTQFPPQCECELPPWTSWGWCYWCLQWVKWSY